jgi:hypothetical protein
METVAPSAPSDSGSNLYIYVIIIVVLAIFIGGLVYMIRSTPSHSDGFMSGVSAGSGHPDCLRDSPESSAILDMLSSSSSVSRSVFSSYTPHYKELQLIFSKLACFKKDLMSPSGVVNATRFQPFETSHDRVAVAELTGMCLNQSVSARDLDISFVSWRNRALILLHQLSTDVNLSENDVLRAEKMFKHIFDDIYDISTGRCIKKDMSTQGGEGDIGSFVPESLKNLREYTHQFGGLSGSGGNSA